MAPSMMQRRLSSWGHLLCLRLIQLQALAAAMAALAWLTANGYTNISQIGRGGMAVVFKAGHVVELRPVFPRKAFVRPIPSQSGLEHPASSPLMPSPPAAGSLGNLRPAAP